MDLHGSVMICKCDVMKTKLTNNKHSVADAEADAVIFVVVVVVYSSPDSINSVLGLGVHECWLLVTE